MNAKWRKPNLGRWASAEVLRRTISFSSTSGKSEHPGNARRDGDCQRETARPLLRAIFGKIPRQIVRGQVGWRSWQ